MVFSFQLLLVLQSVRRRRRRLCNICTPEWKPKRAGNWMQRWPNFRKPPSLIPSWLVAFVDLGDVYIEKRDYAAAIPPLKRAVELSPGLEGGHRLLGYALLAQGYASEAIPHLEQAHAEDALGIALLDAGKLPEAMPVLQKALSQSPDDPELLYYYGRASGLLSKQVFDELEDSLPGFRARP